MRSSHWASHALSCEDCRRGHLCDQGREILTRRWTRTVPGVPVSGAARTEINIRNLITGAGC
jgi:hypothetical protein